MKKIAIFQTDLNIGGIQKSCVNLINNIDSSKYKVDLYLVEKENIFLKDISENINIKYIKKLPYFTKLIPINILFYFYNPKISENYDVAIDFNSYSNETAISAIKTKSKSKIMWIHNDIEIKIKEEPLYRILHFMFKKKYKYFDKFIAVSSGASSSFFKVNKLTNKKTDVIPNLIDTKEIQEKLKEKATISVDQTKINICSTARVVHQKGFDILVNEINKIKNQLANFHFYIIGDGPMLLEIKKMINKNNLDNLITLTGFLNNPYPLMKQMDAFILLSRYEGQGMVFLEAASLGLDIIMPIHLEKYVDDEIKGSKNIGEAILNLKKHSHEFNRLESYNKRIKDKINNL